MCQQVPSFPNYTGATSSTLRDNSDNVQFFSMIMYGVNRQIYSFGSPNPVQALRNSELGNQEIATNSDESATFVIYPPSANLGAGRTDRGDREGERLEHPPRRG